MSARGPSGPLGRQLKINMETSRALPSWDALLDRFAAFQSMPCLRAEGPDTKRPDRLAIKRRLDRQFDRERPHLPKAPDELTQDHILALLSSKGRSTRGAGKRPDCLELWHGLWRAIILWRDDYTCYFCRRSAETGVLIEGQVFALRLELDHAEPRSRGGHDYLLTNIRCVCRTCNLARGRMHEAYFRAELESLQGQVTNDRT